MRELLTACGLPIEGLDRLERVVVRHDEGSAVIACAGLERHAHQWLLRSVAVAPEHRGEGLGADVVEEALDGIDGEVVLLTESAAAWFDRFGFDVVDRSEVDGPVTDSAMWTSLCPASATVMIRR